MPATSSASLKAFAMRLVLASDFSHAGLVALLQQRRAQVATHHAVLEQTAGAVDEEADLGQRLALDYGLALAFAELAWLDSTVNRLAQPLPTEDVQSIASHRTSTVLQKEETKCQPSIPGRHG